MALIGLVFRMDPLVAYFSNRLGVLWKVLIKYPAEIKSGIIVLICGSMLSSAQLVTKTFLLSKKTILSL